MEEDEFQVTAPDGRRLFARVVGPSTGPLVFFHVGTPSTRYLSEKEMEEGIRRGLRQVCYSRPGYGGSDRDPGRSVASCAADTASVADELGADAFYVVGHSGGAPHALACADLLPDRVIATAALAAFAPRHVVGQAWMEGTGWQNQEEFEALERGDAELERYLRGVLAQWAQLDDLAEFRRSFDGFLSPADEECLTGSFLRFQLRSCRRLAREDVWGWFDDDRALWGDWGFDPARIDGPVAVWHGEADLVVPADEGRRVAEWIDGARLHLLPEDGHWSLFVRHYGAVLDELIEIGR